MIIKQFEFDNFFVDAVFEDDQVGFNVYSPEDTDHDVWMYLSEDVQQEIKEKFTCIMH